MESRFAEQNVGMVQVLRVKAGTYFARNPDGTWFAVADDDPRAIGFTTYDQTWVDGQPVPYMVNVFIPAAL